jgi:hypothetical protein
MCISRPATLRLACHCSLASSFSASFWPLVTGRASLVISLGLIALSILMTVVARIGTGYDTDMGAVVHVTWLGPGMLFSALGGAAIVIASILALTERPDSQAVMQGSRKGRMSRNSAARTRAGPVTDHGTRPVFPRGSAASPSSRRRPGLDGLDRGINVTV